MQKLPPTPLILSIIEGANLHLLADFSIKPFIIFQNGDKHFRTGVGIAKGDMKHLWNQEIEIFLEPSQPLIASLYTTDEDGEYEVGRITFLYNDLVEYGEKAKDMWVAFGSENKKSSGNIAGILKTGLISNLGESPQLHIYVKISNYILKNELNVRVSDYRIIIRGEDAFTLYQVTVNKIDGTNWNLELRYSDISALRSEIIRVYPELKKFPFPKKTYFEWLACVWPKLGRFDIRVIEKRKSSIEDLLNYLLEISDKFDTGKLNRLLKLN
ncbi:unnamed protein product [Blepharisma stoltei]|uniref:PX domain-containing protein n=1 Tax=Blepharisma stoltei TaxID=1481888 RepID=A0AAU9IS02_9CILI|nr:unnamed protein product [Blepharisma stoltei]